MPCVRQLYAEGRLRGWFFVRYWEGGPHLRVRLLGSARVLRTRALTLLQEAFTTFVDAYPRDPAIVDLARQFETQVPGSPAVAAGPWRAHGTLAEFAYVAEVRRYGGEQALAISERLFEASSELALALLESADGRSRAHLLGQALDAMLVTLHAFGLHPGVFAPAYASGWQGFVPDYEQLQQTVKTVLRARGPAIRARIAYAGHVGRHGAFAHWTREVALAAAELRELAARRGLTVPTPQAADDPVGAIAASHVHMTSNRLGVTPAEECYLALLLVGAAAG